MLVKTLLWRASFQVEASLAGRDQRRTAGGDGGGCGCCKWPSRDCIRTPELGLQEGPQVKRFTKSVWIHRKGWARTQHLGTPHPLESTSARLQPCQSLFAFPDLNTAARRTTGRSWEMCGNGEEIDYALLCSIQISKPESGLHWQKVRSLNWMTGWSFDIRLDDTF